MEWLEKTPRSGFDLDVGGLPYNPGLLKLIEAKREWDWKPSTDEKRLGFRGWYERGYLPHFDAPNVTQLVTFMLDDSFPVTRRSEWEPIQNEPNHSKRRQTLEAWLDRGYGKCHLRQKEAADAMIESLLSNDGSKYSLRAWVIMPNHVHLVVDVLETPLAKLMHLWKGSTARTINSALGLSGRLWQPDYYDTVIRDKAHLGKAVHYVEANPLKAGFTRDPKAWPWSSASRRQDRGF